MDQTKKCRVFWLVWGLGVAALTVALIQNYTITRTLEPLWIMAIGHSYASTAIIAGLLKKRDEPPAQSLSADD